MSTIKSSDEHLTLNADGSSKDIKFQANGVEKASISSAGAFTSTTIDATKLTGDVPDASFPSTLPAASAANLTAIPAANITGTLPAISGANLTNLPSADVSVDSWHLSLDSSTDFSTNQDIDFSTTQHLGSNLSESGGVITVGTAGMYLVSYSAITLASPNRGFDLNIEKNGSIVPSTYIHSNADSYSGWGVTVNLQLAANDTIKVRGKGHFYGNSQAMSRFIGTRIGA